MKRVTCRLYDLCIYTGPTTNEIENGERVIIVGTQQAEVVVERITDGRNFQVLPAGLQLVATSLNTPHQVV